MATIEVEGGFGPPAVLTAAAPRRSHTAWRRIALGAIVVAALGVEAGLFATHVGNGAAFADVRWGWLLAAIAAELISVASLGAVYRPLLRAGGVTVSRGRGVAFGAASSAITATAPAGTAVASAYLYRQFRRAGGSSALAGWTVTVAAGLSIAAFGAVVAAGSAIGAHSPVDSVWQVVGGGLATALVLVAAVTALTRRPDVLLRLLLPLYRRLPGRAENRAARDDRLAASVAQLAAIRPGVRQWLLAASFATLTWAADLACFLLSLRAMGVAHVGLGAAALAYGAGLATVSISLIPGGIGTVEAGMLLGLTTAGAAGPAALAGIVTYRVVAYVLVAAAGWTVWAFLRKMAPAPAELVAPTR
ncbi:MAG: putative heme transporter [Pseudonocardiales bacterium]|nr:putative heme transporter [Pseudonocardiales bacterium]